MLNKQSFRRVNSLKSLLAWCFGGSCILFIVVFGMLMDHLFELGVLLRTQANFERYASVYEQQFDRDPEAALPTGPNLFSYKDLSEIPQLAKTMFPEYSFSDRELAMLNDEEELFQSVIDLVPKCGDEVCELMFVYSHRLESGQWLYMFQGVVASDDMMAEIESTELIILVFILGVLLICGAIAIVLVRKISQPVQQLAVWADGLTLETLDKKVPDFQFTELNRVAEQLNSAFNRISASVEKEHRFLQHMSHELRTPLATASGNLEILGLIGKKQPRSEMEDSAIARLNYAINDMKQLTETLLWLNRDEDCLPEKALVSLNELIHDIASQNTYLLESKNVSLSIHGDESELVAHKTLCNIVLTNLIRNAFQYTYEGTIHITFSSQAFTIINENMLNAGQEESCETQVSPDQVDYGFGLGLNLVEQITARLGWHYQADISAAGYSTTITFFNQ